MPTGTRLDRLALKLSTLLMVMVPWTSVRADIFRWDNGEVIAGTEGIRLGIDTDLSGIDLSYAYLRGDLGATNFENSVLFAADLSSSDLSDIILVGADVRRANFSESGSLTEQQLSTTSSYQTADLYGLDLSRKNIGGWDFRGQNLTDARFERSEVGGADFAGAIIKGATFANAEGFTEQQLASTASYQVAELQGIDLSHINVTGWNFSGQNLTDSRFDTRLLTSTNFADAVLRRADLVGEMVESDFSGADLRESNLSGAIFTRAGFAGAHLTGATISGVSRATEFHDVTAHGFTAPQFYSTESYRTGDLSRIVFRENEMSGWDFRGKNLTGARLSNNNLSSTNFREATLVDAFVSDAPNSDFRGADLGGVRLVGDFRGTDFSGTDWSQSARRAAPSLILNSANLVGTNLATFDFSESSLFGTDFTGAILTDAEHWSSLSLGTRFNGRTSAGFTKEQLYSTASYQSGNLQRIQLLGNDLTSWNFRDVDLRGAAIRDSTLDDVDMQDALVEGANLKDVPKELIYETASYKNKELTKVRLTGDLDGWDFNGQRLVESSFSGSLKNATFREANLRAANFDADLGETDFTNANLAFARFQEGALKGTTVLTGANLESASLFGTLTDMNLAGLNLAKINTGFIGRPTWVNPDFSDANLAEANLEKNIFTNADFTRANLSQARMQRMEAQGAILKDANLSNARLYNADLTGADLRGANLTQASLVGTVMTDADLTDAIVRGAIFQENNLEKTQLYATASYQSGDLTETRFFKNDMSGWNFEGVDLTDARIELSNLADANFSNANLHHVSFFQSDLTNAVFTHARLSNARLAGVDAAGADMTGADLTNAALGGNFENAIFLNAIIRGAGVGGLSKEQVYSTASYAARDLTGIHFETRDLSGWDFSGQKLTGATLGKLVGADITNAWISDVVFRDSELTAAQLYSTASYQARNLRAVDLESEDLSGWDFRGQDLTGAVLGWLQNADLTDASIAGADLTLSRLTSEQLYSTASYRDKQLHGINFGNGDISGWDFTGQDLRDAILGRTTNASFTDAIVAGASFRSLEREQLYSTASYRDGDLTGIRLDSHSMAGWSFENQNLTDAWFRDADIVDGNMRGANLLRTNLRRVTLAGADLRGAHIVDADLSGANLSGAKLNGARLTAADLSSAKSSGADLTSANLRGIDLANANFEGAKFDGADLTDSQFSSAVLQNATFNNAIITGAALNRGFSESQLMSTASYGAKQLHGISFPMDMSGWDLSGQDLSKSTFFVDSRHALLDGANFSGAIVTNVNFKLATNHGLTLQQLQSTASYQQQNLSGINLSSNDLANSDFQDQRLEGAVFADADLRRANFAGAQVTGASFAGARLDNSDFSGSIIEGADFTNVIGFTADQLYATDSYQQKSLRNVTFASVALPSLDLRELDLSGATFRGLDFVRDLNFEATRLDDATIAGATFENVSLRAHQLYSTASYKARSLQGLRIEIPDMSRWNLSEQDLTGSSIESSLAFADLSGSNLTDVFIRGSLYEADLSDAIIVGSGLPISPEQLYSTASYKSGNLQRINFFGHSRDVVTGSFDWNFANQNLEGAWFSNVVLDHTDLTGANLTNSYFIEAPMNGTKLTGADMRCAYLSDVDFTRAITRNLINADGSVAGLIIGMGQPMVIRDHDGNPTPDPRLFPNPLPPIPITVRDEFTIRPGGRLRLEIEPDHWDSVISVADETAIALGGVLELAFTAEVNVRAQAGRTLNLFNWNQELAPANRFDSIAAAHDGIYWDLRQLYASGEVSIWRLGDVDTDLDVDSRDRNLLVSNWTGAMVPCADPTSSPSGDFDGDCDVDSIDQHHLIRNWTGPQQAGLARTHDDVQLLYNAATGAVSLDASRSESGVLISFIFETAGGLRAENLRLPFVDVGTNTDNEMGQIGQSDVTNVGVGRASLGDIFPTGMSQDDLRKFLIRAQYASSLGHGGELALLVVPEPTSLGLLILAAAMSGSRWRTRGPAR